MDVQEFTAAAQQLVREREALNGAYADLQSRLASEAAEAAVQGKRPQEEAIPALVDLAMKLGNFVNMEREHSDKLCALLLDMGNRLAEAYDIELPRDWPRPM